MALLLLKTELPEPDSAMTDQEPPPLVVERSRSGPPHQSIVDTTTWLAFSWSTHIPA
jgi:hypothetical protein